MKQVNVKTMRAVPQNGGDMYDCIVIGAGIAGAVAARKLAEEKGKRVLVMERRPHIGGNCYDEKDAHGILIHNFSHRSGGSVCIFIAFYGLVPVRARGGRKGRGAADSGAV